MHVESLYSHLPVAPPQAFPVLFDQQEATVLHETHLQHSHTHEHVHSHSHGHEHTHYNTDPSEGAAQQHNVNRQIQMGPVRNYSAIAALIDESDLPASVQSTAKQAFLHLAEAEAQVHGSTLEEVRRPEQCLVPSL